VTRVAMLLPNPFTHDARVEREARTLAEAGHEVRVFCLAGPGLADEETRDGYRLRRVAGPGWLSWTGPRRAVPLARWFGRYAFLAEEAAAWRPEVVHGHDLETLLPAGRLAARLGALHVHDDHELGLEKIGQGTESLLRGPRRWAMEAVAAALRARGAALERRWIPRAAALVTACPMYGDVLRARYGVEPVVLRNTPWRSDLPPDPRLRGRAGLADGTKVALYQGSITAGGGGQQCIAAARDFPEGWALVFLGTTWMRPRLEAEVRAAGLGDRVKFLDPVPPAELPGFTRAADVGLAPIRPVNLGQAYSLANKLFEYLHAGLPIVSSDIPAQAALVRELDAGVVLPEVTPASVAEAVRRLAALPDAGRRATGERLRAEARARLCWEVESEGLVRLYARLVPAR